MFDSLSDKLQGALGDLRKKGKLDEESINRAMREIRLALLEADVNFTVVRDFVARVREKARRYTWAARGERLARIVRPLLERR